MAFNNASEHHNNMRIEKEKEKIIPIIIISRDVYQFGKNSFNEKDFVVTELMKRNRWCTSHQEFFSTFWISIKT